MSPPPPKDTRQVNLKLTPSQEEVVRLLVKRLRETGFEFEARVRTFLSEPPMPRYMHINELDRRFGEIERRLLHLEMELGSASDGDALHNGGGETGPGDEAGPGHEDPPAPGKHA
jgi:hypothetical protein